MDLSIVHQRKFWFYVRKAIFQGIIPIIFGFLTFYDLVKQTTNPVRGQMYNHMYFYTSLILFIYAQAKIILEFVFAICADDIVFKKEISLTQTMPAVLLSEELQNDFIIIIKILKPIFIIILQIISTDLIQTQAIVLQF